MRLSSINISISDERPYNDLYLHILGYVGYCSLQMSVYAVNNLSYIRLLVCPCQWYVCLCLYCPVLWL